MEYATVYLALGSNTGESKAYITQAMEMIELGIGSIKKHSSLYLTKPLSTPTKIEQGDFLNLILEISTPLKPKKLLLHLLEIEKRLHRDRSSDLKWGPRTIDIDIIFYDSQVILTDELVIPHPEYAKRDFVLAPLIELNIDMKDPILQETPAALLAQIPKKDHTIISSEALDDFQ